MRDQVNDRPSLPALVVAAAISVMIVLAVHFHLSRLHRNDILARIDSLHAVVDTTGGDDG